MPNLAFWQETISSPCLKLGTPNWEQTLCLITTNKYQPYFILRFNLKIPPCLVGNHCLIWYRPTGLIYNFCWSDERMLVSCSELHTYIQLTDVHNMDHWRSTDFADQSLTNIWFLLLSTMCSCIVSAEPLSKSLVLASDWHFQFPQDGLNPSPCADQHDTTLFHNQQHSTQELMTSLPNVVTSPLDMTSSHNLMMTSTHNNMIDVTAQNMMMSSASNLLMTTENMMMSSSASRGMMSHPDMMPHDLMTSSVGSHSHLQRPLPAGTFLNPYHRPVFHPPSQTNLQARAEPMRMPLSAPTRGKDDSFFLKRDDSCWVVKRYLTHMKWSRVSFLKVSRLLTFILI